MSLSFGIGWIRKKLKMQCFDSSDMSSILLRSYLLRPCFASLPFDSRNVNGKALYFRPVLKSACEKLRPVWSTWATVGRNLVKFYLGDSLRKFFVSFPTWYTFIFLFTFTIFYSYSLHVSDRLIHHQENQITRAASGTFPCNMSCYRERCQMLHV